MLNAGFPSRRFTANLVLAGALLLPSNLTGQTAPAKSGSTAESQLPAGVQAKLAKLRGDLKAAQAKPDSAAEAKALNGIGDVYSGISESLKALDSYSQALALARSAKDTLQNAAALDGIASCFLVQSRNSEALNSFQQALELATASGDLREQAKALNGIGWVNNNLGQPQKALEFHNRALPLAQSVGDNDLEAKILNRIAIVDTGTGDTQAALDLYNRALSAFREAADSSGEARTLTNIGVVRLNLSENQKALDSFNQALAIYSRAGDRFGPAGTLNDMALVYSALGQKQKALQYDKRALALFRQAGDTRGQNRVLFALASLYGDLGQRRRALENYSQVLAAFRQSGDRPAEGAALLNMGIVYSDLGEYQMALECYQQAQPILSQTGDRSGEANVLIDIGLIHAALGEKEKALEYYDEALAIYRQVGNRDGEVRTLTDVGDVYNDLGDNKMALQYHQQALPMYRQAGERDGEAGTLNNIGLAYRNLGDSQTALKYYTQSLPIFHQIGDSDGEAEVYENIAGIYNDLGEKEKALDDYNQALKLASSTENKQGQMLALAGLGWVQNGMGESQKAIQFLKHAMQLATALQDPLLEADVSFKLMIIQRSQQPALAAFYGKQAVNLLQQVRRNIQGLDKELQGSFLNSKDDFYHDLADLLIAQGRLPEAQQVLDLIKRQEYSDYVRGETANALSPLSLTPAEQQAQEDYRQSTAQLVSLGEQWVQLKKITTRTPDQEKQYRQLSDQLDQASNGLNGYYARLYVLFGKDSHANRQVADVKGDVSLLRQIIAKMPHTVARYTLVGKDRTSIIVITSSATVAREYAISEIELNEKVADFEQLLRDPATDPKPLGQELYKILIGPVSADLNQAQAETVVLSLDGVLRYVPMAALYDGKQYLVEKYNTVTITPASIAHLSEKPDVRSLSVAGMGISQEYESNLPALPAVVGELDDVVKDPQVKAAHGVLPGTILLNGQFTEKAMENQLGGQHTVVHIASHFVFKPGDDSQSYLLLAGKDAGGRGYHLTVADFRDNQNLSLDDTDLLTLSACETGMSGSASNGREVDGLGTTAQLKGAKAVISTLWEVNDDSTGQLMGDFYKRWAEGAGDVTKVEALRQAQLDLLRGRVMPQAGDGGMGMGAAHPDLNSSSDYAHPYYWAPFVLMGNWR